MIFSLRRSVEAPAESLGPSYCADMTVFAAVEVVFAEDAED